MTDREIKLLDKAYKDARLAARNSQASAKIQLDRIKKFSKDLAKGTPEGDAAYAELERLGRVALEAATKEKEAKAKFDEAKSSKDSVKNANKNELEALARGEIYVPPKSKKELEAEAESESKPRSATDAYLKSVARSTPEQIRNLQQLLKNAGKNYLGVPYYSGPVDGKFNIQLGQAITSADNEMNMLETQTGKTVNRDTFFQDIAARGINAPAGGTGGGANLPTGTRTIYTPTEAKSIINTVSESILGREATPEELSKLTADLKKAQSKAITTTKYSMVNGVRVADVTGNLDEVQFLSDLIKKNPEYNKRKEGIRAVGKQDLLKTAVANGLDLDKTFASQLPTWIKRIEAGENPEVFKQIIRQTAKIGLPDKVSQLLDQGLDLDAVYAPYRNTMASLLEVNPDSISLNDALLRTAIQGDKEMPIYDFQRQIKKDSRWQYTNNAREEVAGSVQQVLRDFGFQR
jgi:hypothetical protein